MATNTAKNGSENGTTTTTKPATLSVSKGADATNETQNTKALLKPIPTVETMREKLEKLNLLFDREEKLRDSKKSLENFRIASDEGTNRLDLGDGKGASFRTSNPTVIKEVIALIMKEIETKLSLTGEEIVKLG